MRLNANIRLGLSRNHCYVMKDIKYLRAWEIFHWYPTVTFRPCLTPSAGTHITLVLASTWYRNWFSAMLGLLTQSHTLIIPTFSLPIFSWIYLFGSQWNMPNRIFFHSLEHCAASPLCVLCRMMTWVSSLAGMYQVSPRHHYVCIFTNVKIVDNMSGTDGDTPSVHLPLPGLSTHKS